MNDDTGGLARALALAAQFGFAIACPMVAFIGGGAWLDTKVGGHWLLFAGIFLGIAAAGAALYEVIRLQTPRRTNKAPYKVEKDKRGDQVGTHRADKRERNGR